MKRLFAGMLVVAGCAAYAADDAFTGERAAVEAFHGSLIEAMRTGDFAAREALLGPPVQAFFDFPTIARVSLGRTWRGLQPGERERFVDLLTELVVTTYASRFGRFDGQVFETAGAREAGGGVAVSTRLIRREGGDVALDYFFRGSKVFNVVADGVSDLSLRRADYSSIVKSEGFAALLIHLDAKIRQARSEG